MGFSDSPGARTRKKAVSTLLNLELLFDPEIVAFTLEGGADGCCIVPENRQEITTEGGLSVVAERARFVELHTGTYANAAGDERAGELDRLRRAATIGAELGLRVNAGHGLDYENVQPVASIPEVEELNIGHSIVSRSLMVGAAEAVREMLALVRERP